MQLQFDVLSVREIKGKQDASKKYTLVCGVADIGGKREYVEVFAPTGQMVSVGQNVLELEIGASFDHKLVAKVKAVHPHRKAAAA
jgi:hypothetical protein